MSDEFLQYSPTLDNYWRSIILFGRNVASYKFALAKSLLEFRERGNDLITLEELAEPFSRNLCSHLAAAPKQATSPSSKFLTTCKSFNEGEISGSQLIEATSKLGFVNVIDAFHNVNQGEIEKKFFLDERKTSKGIRLTDDLFSLFETSQFSSLSGEVEARWRLVETAWELNISKRLIAVDFDPISADLFVNKIGGRVDITSSRDALNGYQKGKCFHCFSDISISPNHADLADVDHFFPWKLKEHGVAHPVDGVWNLVLACKGCNRGRGGKSARVPSIKLLYRLKKRNDFLINSHHPLRETLIAQTGGSEAVRKSFLQKTYNEAKAILIHEWDPEMTTGQVF
jgi:hypothetical protein